MERTIALVGHNVITLEHAERARRGVRVVLEGLAAQRADQIWRLLTPLAPGSDYVLTRAALDWLDGATVELTICQHVELSALVRAWVEQGGLERGTPDGERVSAHFNDTSPAAIEAEVCAQLMTLRARAKLVQATEPLALEAALALNDAYLLEHADELVVAVDGTRFGAQRNAFMQTPLEELPPFGSAHLARSWLARGEKNGDRSRRLHIVELSSL